MKAPVRQLVIITAASGLFAGLLYLLVWTGPSDPFRTSDPAIIRMASGRTLYNAHCLACHGDRLQGQPDWQSRLASGRLPAPPHDASGHSWHHADDVLIGITKHGLKPYAGEDYESDMPAFAEVLRDDEIETLWYFIKSTWSERERRYQEQMTRQAELTR